MSIKIYDPKTAQWLPYSSNLAKEIRVIDTEGNFAYEDEDGVLHTANNVEDALKLMAQNMEKLADRVEYIYENGTIGGGGGGGGGSVMPTITLTTPTSYSVSTDEEIVIQYNFTSPNIGFGTANITVSGTKNYTVAQTVSQGTVRFNAGKFESGKYTISIYVIDAGGMFSNTVLIDVASGSLQLKSNFDDSIDYTLADEIEIPYTLSSISNDPVEVTYTLDGQEETHTLAKGNHTWRIGNIETTGAHRASISAVCGDMVANTLDFTIMIADASSMYIASNFNTTEIEEGRKIVIPYRVSMAGETRAIVKRWINGQEQAEENILLGTGYKYWQVGNTLRAGRYTFKLQAFTTDRAIASNVLEFTVDVVEGGFKLLDTVTEGAMCMFNADGKSSGAVDKNEWVDKSGNNVRCTLHDFNHNSNGWDGYSLNFNGRSYAEIDLAPWRDNCKYGFTLDFYYKIENVGDIDAKALWMKNHNTPYQGIYVDTQTANIRSGASKIIETYFRDSSKEDVWEHVAFVVDRELKLMYIYINGIISKIIAITSGETFTFDGKILLGAGRDSSGEVANFANCSIRSLNVYNRALTDEEVLQNYIANFATADEQKLIYELNYGDSQIPTMSFVGNMSGMNEDEEVDMQITYNDPLDTTKNFSQDRCKVSWQGTSSLLYPIKNYTIKLRENGQDWAYTPKDEWKTETRYTLKANYMESSHANNIGGAKFFNDLIKTYHPYPSQQIDENCRGAIDGFHIRLMINGEYQGIYTFNIDRYAYNNLGLPLGSETMSYEIGVNSDGGAGAFNTKTDDDLTWDSIRREFDYRYHYAGTEEVVTELDTDGKTRILSGSGYHDALVDLVKWTAESDDTTFKGDIAQNWSLPHLIDYYLFVLLVGLVDNLG